MIHKELFSEHMRSYKVAFSTAKTDYYASLISSGEGNTRTLFLW